MEKRGREGEKVGDHSNKERKQLSFFAVLFVHGIFKEFIVHEREPETVSKLHARPRSSESIRICKERFNSVPWLA